MPSESNGENRENADWKAPPTGAELNRRALEIIKNLMMFPAQERNMRLGMQRDALDEAVEAIRVVEAVRTGDYDEDSYDPGTLAQLRDVARHYPGYRETDVRDLQRMLPEGMDSSDTLADVISSVVIESRLAAYAGKKSSIDIAAVTADQLRAWSSADNPLVAELTPEDWDRAAEFIRANPKMDVRNIREAL